MQLARIALGTGVPVAQALLPARLRRRRLRAQVRFDGEVVTHGVALGHAAYAANVLRLSAGLRADHGETHLRAAGGAEIDAHRELARDAVAVRIVEMDKGAVRVERRG